MFNCSFQSGNQTDSKKTCANCLKRQFSLLNELGFEDLTTLEKSRYVLRYQRGELIYKKGDKPLNLFCLSEGKVKIAVSGVHGEQQITSLKKQGDFIGLSDLIRDDHYSASAVAIEDCSICVIPSKVLFDLLRKNGEFSLTIIKYLASQLEIVKSRIENLTQKHMLARMADTLILIHNTFGISQKDQSLNVQFKRSELAALSNMTTSNVSRMLSDLSKSNLIELEHRKIRIVRMEKLQNISLIG